MLRAAARHGAGEGPGAQGRHQPGQCETTGPAAVAGRHRVAEAAGGQQGHDREAHAAVGNHRQQPEEPLQEGLAQFALGVGRVLARGAGVSLCAHGRQQAGQPAGQGLERATQAAAVRALAGIDAGHVLAKGIALGKVFKTLPPWSVTGRAWPDNTAMKQQDLGLNLSKRRTRKAVFLDEMNLVVPWSELLALIAPHAPRAKTGRPPFELETMLRIHFVQQWFGLSDLAMEEALFETALYREFVGLSSVERIPDRVSILRFRHLLEEHHLAERILATVNATLTDKGLMLRQGTVVDATLIAAPSSTKNSTGTRDPEMHQTKKGNQWHFGMKAHIGVDADSGLVHTVVGTAANVNDVTQASKLVHGEETDVFADAGYRGVEKRKEIQAQHPDVNWHIAMMPGKRRAMDKGTPMGAILEKLEQTKASIRAKVEHPFRVIKRQFGYVKVKYRGTVQEHGQSEDAVCAE